MGREATGENLPARFPAVGFGGLSFNRSPGVAPRRGMKKGKYCRDIPPGSG